MKSSAGVAADRPLLLLAEDNAVNAHVALLMLHRLGYRVDLVGDGRAAVEAVGRARYRAVLMDCQMPGMDGYAATARIRDHELGRRRTPIIAMTGHALQGDRARCLAAGMDDYLAKPVRAEDLAAALRRWLPWSLRPPAPPGGMGGGRAAPSVPGVDRETLERLRGLADDGAVDVVRDLAGVFHRDATVRLAAMADAEPRGDAAAIGQQAHALKGSSACLGADRMAGLCGELEWLADAGDLGSVGAVLQQVGGEFWRVRAALDAYLAEA